MIQNQLIKGCEHPRPKDRTDEIIIAVAMELASHLGEYIGEAGDEGLGDIREVLENNYNWDGFELARDLERDGWSADAQLVEILDQASGYQYDAHRAAIAKWVKEFDIQPQLAIGAVVVIADAGKFIDGIVCGIDHDQATYTISRPSRGDTGHLPKDEQWKAMRTIGVNLPFEAVEK